MQCKVVLALQEKAEKTCNNIRIEGEKNRGFTWSREAGIQSSHCILQTWDFYHQMRIP